MNELNPYQPYGAISPADNLDYPDPNGSPRRLLPRTFWVVWFGFIVVCVVFLTLLMYQTAVHREVVVWLALPLMGLFIAPFILLRAKLCERYQHRCVGSSGVTIFLACLGVCFGLAWASLSMMLLLWMFTAAILIDALQSTTWVSTILSVGFQLFALIVFLKLIDLSAKRPKWKQQSVSS